MDITRYYIGFNRVNGIGPARLDRLIGYFGSVEAAWHASAGELQATGLEPKLISALLTERRTLDLDAELEQLVRVGAHAICREDPAYPVALAQIALAPPVIYVRGQLRPGDAWSVGVVGTRSPTIYGKEAARTICEGLVISGVTIVSGLALGIDAVAHHAAIAQGGRTVAVLPAGVDQVYPERHQRLAQQIIEAGALVSEFPLGQRPLPALFPVRNRLISGLARGVVVIEAGAQSGALITVNYALDQGRDVFAVPGSIFSNQSRGTNQLLRRGAVPVTSAADVLDGLDFGRVVLRDELNSATSSDPVEAALLQILEHEPMHLDDLCRGVELPVAVVGAAMSMLEIKGQVRACGVAVYVRV